MKLGYKETKLSSKKAIAKGYDTVEMSNPRVSLNTKVLPEVKNWKVGKEYKVELTIKMTGLHEEYGDDKQLCGDFEVIDAKGKS